MNNKTTAPASQLSQRAALARLAAVTAPRPSPAPFGFISCTFSASLGHAPARELPARFSFDAKNEGETGEILLAVISLGYTVKMALFVRENRSFFPLFVSEPETADAAAKHGENTVRRVMGHSAPLYTESTV